MDWILFLSLFSIHNFVFLSICALRKSFSAGTKKYVIIELLVFAEIMMFKVFIYKELIAIYSFLFFINYTFIFSGSPYFLALIDTLVGNGKKKDLNRMLIFFIPFGVSICGSVWFYLQPVEFRRNFFVQINNAHIPWLMVVLELIFFLQTLIAISICYIRIYRFREANPNNGNIKWLWPFINKVAFLVMFIYIPIFVSFFSVATTLFCYSVASVVFYDLFSYTSLVKCKIFTDHSILIVQPEMPLTHTIQLETLLTNEVQTTPPETLSTMQTISEDLRQKISMSVMHLMEKDKYFLDSSISLNSLAEKSNTPKYLLTQYLNQYHENFYDFINRYRIEEAKKLLTGSDRNKYNIEVIAQKCGFRSRSVFYSAFKKYTGVTPIQFIKTINSPEKGL